jgi:tetratricopeptide (TPR) repeat protein
VIVALPSPLAVTSPLEETVATASSELEVRALSGEAWARMQQGEVQAAIELLIRARTLTEGPAFSDVDRAEVLYRLAVCRYKLSSISTALALFNEAYALASCVRCLTVAIAFQAIFNNFLLA